MFKICVKNTDGKRTYEDLAEVQLNMITLQLVQPSYILCIYVTGFFFLAAP